MDLCEFEASLIYIKFQDSHNYTERYECPEILSQKLSKRDWRDGSVVKSTGYSSRGPRFNSQHPLGSSQQSVTPVPGDLTPSHQ